MYKCKFYKKEDHKEEDFKKLDVVNRWNWVRKNKTCFTCMTSSHQTKLCRQGKKCGKNDCPFKQK